MSTAVALWTPKQAELIKKTVAKDCDRNSAGDNLHLGEFDWFMSICKSLRLDPLRRQIYAFVFSKDDPSRRQMVPVVGIGGYRSIAERTGNYRPGDSEITFDESLRNPESNPAGIVCAKVTVFKRAAGEWFSFSETAYWEEFAPLVTKGDAEEWVDTGNVYPPGHKKAGKPVMRKQQIGPTRLVLDPSKDGWRKMPRLMIEKCAEAKALRRGWPDDFAGTYAEGELDRAEVLDLTATEMAEQAATDDRLAKVGAVNTLTVQWEPGGPLVQVPTGKFFDEAMKWVRDGSRTGQQLVDFRARNAAPLQEFWARHKGDALELRDRLNDRLTQLAEASASKLEAAE